MLRLHAALKLGDNFHAWPVLEALHSWLRTSLGGFPHRSKVTLAMHLRDCQTDKRRLCLQLRDTAVVGVGFVVSGYAAVRLGSYKFVGVCGRLLARASVKCSRHRKVRYTRLCLYI